MYDFEKRGNTPIFKFLCQCIKDDISRGTLRSGDRLPSKRRTASQYGISVTSVQNAYEQLISEGYIVAHQKKGYYVSDISDIPDYKPVKKEKRANKTPSQPETNIRSTAGNDLFPFSVWSRLMRLVLSEQMGNILLRTHPNGVFELRAAISDYLYRSSGIDISPERIVVGAGTEYLCSLIVMLLGRTKIYGFEDPGYKKIAYLISSCGAGIRFLETDKEGVKRDSLEKSGACVLHVSPSNQYPTGNLMTAPRRYSLLSWLEESEERYIIEDDYGSEIYLCGRKMPTLFEIDPCGRVIYMNTFTTTISPSFRIGYLILPEKLCEKLKNDLGFLSCTVPSFEQYTLARFISDGHFESYLSKQRTRYRNTLAELKKEISNIPGIELEYHGTGTNVILKPTKKTDNERIKKIASSIPCLSMLNDYRKNKIENDTTMILDISLLDKTNDISFLKSDIFKS